MNICIIDYGSGNLHSVAKAFEQRAAQHSATVQLTRDPGIVAQSSHIVLPGVGAFGDCVTGLRALDGMWEALNGAVIEKRIPFFGICVGMQMMLERGLEHGEHKGLGWIKGDVVPLADDNITQSVTHTLKIPHMGWNELTLMQPHPVLSGLGKDAHVYFVHSYHAQCANHQDILAISDYGAAITACIGRSNLIGTQFHPEKSGEIGLKMIDQFVQWDGSL